MKNIIETVDSINFKFWTIICISLSLIIRLILINYFFSDDTYLTFSDQSKYIYRSDLILTGEFFSEAWGALRMPIYPIFLATIKFIYSDLFLIIVLQNVLLLLSYNYIIRFNNFFPTFAIKIYLLIFSISLNIIIYSQLILTEALVLPLSIIFYFLIFDQYYLKNKSNYSKIAFVFAILSLIKPQFLYLSPLVILFPFFIIDEKYKIKNVLKIFFIFFIIINCWLMRNLIVYNAYSLSASKVPNIVSWYIPIIDQQYSNLDYSTAKKKSYKKWEAYKKDLDEKKIKNPFYQDKFAINFFYYSFEKFPLKEIISSWSYGSIKTLFTPGIVELSYWMRLEKTKFSSLKSPSILLQIKDYIFKNKNKTYGFAMFVSIILIFIIRLVSCFSLFFFINKKNFPLFLFLILMILINLILIGPIGSARYRLFIEPILILFFSVGLSKIFEYFKK